MTGEHLTDLGNARRLVEQHGRDIRYCADWNRWLRWDDICWKTDEDGELMRCAKATVARMYEDAALARDENGRKDLARHAARSESEKSLKAMISLAASEPGIPVRSHELDQKPMLLGAPNGVIDLVKGVLVEPCREDLITKRVAAPFDPHARCPTWEAFLESILPDSAVRDFYQRAVGYSLTGLTVEQVLFLEYGTGANGKTTATESLLDTFGDYATKTPRDTLLARRETGIPNDVARLRGARFVAAVELEEGRRLAEARVKELTGGDTVSARFMRGEWFDFRPKLKLWIATNHKPEIRGTDRAIWRRIRLLPFTVTIPDDEQDQALPTKLRRELPGILRWAVEGCLAWQREGLAAPSAVLAATEEYRQEEDTLGAFFAERCVFGDGYSVAAGAMRKEYGEWCEGTGEKVITAKRFAAALKDKGCQPGNRGFGRSGARGWHGVRLQGGD